MASRKRSGGEWSEEFGNFENSGTLGTGLHLHLHGSTSTSLGVINAERPTRSERAVERRIEWAARRLPSAWLAQFGAMLPEFLCSRKKFC